ncbi:MAG: DUF3105 domain-containing protein [Motilibacteraceae bacterium]
MAKDTARNAAQDTRTSTGSAAGTTGGGKNRRAVVAEMREQQQRAERRKTLLIVGGALVAGVLLIAAVAVPALISSRNDPAKKAVSALGVSASAASCDAPITDPVSGSGVHVGPGTDKPDETTVKYATVPPTSGEHFAVPAPFGKDFYTTADVPKVEELVHNLEHGYTILWYPRSADTAQQDTIKALAAKMAALDETGRGKFIAAPWDPAYGAFPAGKSYALSHWGQKQGYRQICGQLSGQVVQDFVKAHPYTDSPEPQSA